MEEQRAEQESLIEKIKVYISLRGRLAVLSTVEKVAELYAASVSKLLLAFCFIMALIFASLGCALWLNEIYNSTWIGFCMLAGFYFFLFFILWLIKSKWIEEPLMDQMVQKMLSEKKKEQDGE